VTAVEFRYGEGEEGLQQKKCMSMKKIYKCINVKNGRHFPPLSGEVKSQFWGYQKKVKWAFDAGLGHALRHR